jgi:glutamate 5-kinase
MSRVEVIDENIEAVAGGTLNSQGIGGMSTKIEAAKLATCSGVDVLIANGREPNILLRVDDGEVTGTLFVATGSKLESRKRWMLSGLACQGRVVVDTGAVRAMKRSAGSLLPAGVVEVAGFFGRGDIVDVVAADGSRIATGIANYSSEDVERIRGQHSDRIADVLGYSYGDEVVHRNNMVVL